MTRALSDDPMQELMDAVDWLAINGPWPADYGLFATHMGWLNLGPWHLKVYTLNDGQRVFDGDSVEEQMG